MSVLEAGPKAKYLNRKWQVNAKHALYSNTGKFYRELTEFPGALFDDHGYIKFETETEFRDCPQLRIGKRVNVDKGGIAAIFGYVQKDDSNEYSSAVDGLIENPNDAPNIYQLVRARGDVQRAFKSALLRIYSSKCAFCGLSFESSLEGAHVKPWSEAKPYEQIDPRNGVLLCATHHRMFDGSGEITITSSYRIAYFDPLMKERRYTVADKALTVDLHGKLITRPKNRQLWPTKDFLASRHDSDGWDGTI
ncbi:HNH endonuclease [Methylocapsa sp. S129]|uniref:HNH endonuclease n=1 Tax=Methylocapsa sp. S129 TaxID=1641869 RepID=UPI00131EA871|nr:HNH endonuclease [Methylocapsa sp. S129]